MANAISDAIAVIDTRKLTLKASKQGMVEPIGFVPTEWMPMSMAFLSSASGGKLYVATAKGKGTGPNNMPNLKPGAPKGSPPLRRTAFIGTILYGSLAALDAAEIEKNLPQWTAVVI